MDELESYSLAEDEDKWITINGSHVKIDENGDVVAGAEGKIKEGANKQVISSQADSLIKISRIWADFFPANTSNQPV
ncbi:NAD-dependent epimerase/dehydratase family protein [Klebsiella quasipneumoniae subsp. similipneumoniae]